MDTLFPERDELCGAPDGEPAEIREPERNFEERVPELQEGEGDGDFGADE